MIMRSNFSEDRDPTRQEIRAAAKRIRSGWSPAEAERRRRGRLPVEPAAEVRRCITCGCRLQDDQLKYCLACVVEAEIAEIRDKGARMRKVAEAFHATTFKPGTNLETALRCFGIKMKWDGVPGDETRWTLPSDIGG